jgi:ATP-binding cassette, subfamily B, multidrug efflux pump
MLGPFTDYTRPYLKRMALGLLAIGVAQAAANTVPMLIRRAIDALELRLESASDIALVAPGIVSAIRSCSLQIAALALVVALGNYLMRRLLGTASTRIEYDIRVRYFSHLLRLPLSYYQNHRTGDLMARATNDLSAVRIFFTYGVRGMVEVAMILVISISMMLWLDWRLALLVLVPFPLFALFLVRMASLVHTRFRAIQDFFGDISNFIQENLAGIRVIKAFDQSPAQNEHFDGLNQTYLDRNATLIQIRAVYRSLSFLTASLGLGLNLWLGGRAVINGSLTMGDFVAFNAYLTLFIRPIMYLGWVMDRSQRALVAMRRINDVLSVEPEIRDMGHSGAARRSLRGHISFSDLSFAYGEEPVLRHINLDVPAGTTLGILGRVGSGKTTLARLVPRLIQAGPGQVRIDGFPVEELPLEELRAHIGYVSQSPFLFSTTMSANIAYGGDEATDALIRQAAAEAQLRADIEGFERGFETVIGERGVTLSGGQKQRTTLARALIRRPDILILDDALSAVDTHTEEAILGHLREIMRDRTTLIIAHRISTLRDADHIIVMDDGAICEQGNHTELVDRDGLYADLFRRQQLAAELETL